MWSPLCLQESFPSVLKIVEGNAKSSLDFDSSQHISICFEPFPPEDAKADVQTFFKKSVTHIYLFINNPTWQISICTLKDAGDARLIFTSETVLPSPTTAAVQVSNIESTRREKKGRNRPMKSENRERD